MTTIVLARGSPRRKDLLSALGLSFEVFPVDIDETPQEGETAVPLVRRLSKQKARTAADRRPPGDALVLAADTVVVLDEALLNKPEDPEQNRAFLRQLSGRVHHVFTGHTLLHAGRCETVVVDTEVRMRQLSEGEIERYVASGEGLDKAGGYAIQGRGSALVSGLAGCYFNVVGLSVPAVVEAAARLGVPLV
ncbi:MAG: Maf family protein [Deinococcales bacterium]